MEASEQDILPIKVLYVEDDLIDQKAFQRYIKNHDIDLNYEIASSVEEAKELLSKNNYDVVITDYLINTETGFVIIDAVKNVPVIFLTGQGNQKVAVEAMKKGAFDYLVKESTGNYLEMLVAAIEKAFRHGNTQKKLAEAQQEIKKLVWTLGQINNSIIMLNKDGKVEWINKGFEELFGYTLEEVKNKTLNEFRKEEISNKRAPDILTEVIQKKGIVTRESKIINKQGKEYFIYTTITPVEYKEGTIETIIIVDTDISDKKKIENELILAKEKAEAAAVTKQQFLANMSHEIRTPVNAIMGIMHMLENTEQPETRKKYMQLITNASNNLLNIINDILDISKMEVGKMVIDKTDFNIRDLVLNIRESMKYRAEEKGLQLNCNISREVPPELLGDPARLNQILINLVGNSIKFTEKGKIDISVKVASCSKNRVTLLFIVSDTGIGIAENARNHLFEYFHQVHSDATRQYGGTGLGLAIIKRLTEIQNGKVWFASKENEGSDFYVELTFDISTAKKEKAKVPPKFESSQLLRGKKILLVEDEALNQMVARHILETEMGAEIEIASNGKIAVEKLEKKDFDLVIMDIQMPEMNGYDATKYIREKMPFPKNETPILAMTAHAFNEEKIKCMEAGMNEFISKPIHIEELGQKLKSLLIK
ncbi:MAG: response regulator [Bacteroidia bacterium]